MQAFIIGQGIIKIPNGSHMNFFFFFFWCWVLNPKSSAYNLSLSYTLLILSNLRI